MRFVPEAGLDEEFPFGYHVASCENLRVRLASVRIDDTPDAICYLRKMFCPSKMRCSLSVSSSAGNIDSMRNS